ncbi:MAG TPA: hypothetical protein VK828_21840 [Terriglobales bacterium]|jgi:hypothetical protein|nr:hypothetical protein [Terriglobales bacterium]
MGFQIRKIATSSLGTVAIMGLLFFAAVNPPRALAVPSFARQTGLPCSGCHYTPPELNPAGRRFKLLGYVDRAEGTKVVTSDGSNTHAALDLLASLPLAVMFETSFTTTKSSVPQTQNGNFEFPQDISLFLSGAWTRHVGSFLQVTYDTQADHFSIDNTDIRYANKTKLSGKELVYGLDLNNNPTVEDLWNTTPAWGFPWISSDVAPTPTAVAIINGSLAQDVAGIGGYAMWNDHLYLDLAVYRSEHVGGPQPNPGIGFPFNIRGVAPYWRVAWQESRGTTQFEIGAYGMHMKTSPNNITGLEDGYTDWAIDTQYDRTLFRKDVLSLRGTYIRENSNLAASADETPTPAASPGRHHLNTFMPNAEFHFGNRYTGTFGWFITGGTVDPLLYPQGAVTGSANGDPRNAGYIANFSYWPWQNLQLAAQYTAYTRFNGAATNYDGAGRSASANNTVYLDAKFIF